MRWVRFPPLLLTTNRIATARLGGPLPFVEIRYPFPFLFLPRERPAWSRAMATACFCGRPDCFSSRMFSETTFFEEPFFRGMGHPPYQKRFHDSKLIKNHARMTICTKSP